MILNILYFINHTCSENTLYAKDKIDFSCDNIDYNDDADDYLDISCCESFITHQYNLTEDTCYSDLSNNYTNILYECKTNPEYVRMYWFIEIIMGIMVISLVIVLFIFIKYYRKNTKKDNMNEMNEMNETNTLETGSLINYSGPMINYSK